MPRHRTAVHAILATALVITSLCASSASAQLPSRPFELYGAAGFARGTGDDAPDGSFGLAGGIRLNIPLAFDIGAEVSYLRLGTVTTDLIEAKYSTIPVTGQVYYSIPGVGISPWVTGGVGMYSVRASLEATSGSLPPGVDDSPSESVLGFNVGAGVDLSAPGLPKLGLDARYHNARTEGDATGIMAILARLYF